VPRRCVAIDILGGPAEGAQNMPDLSQSRYAVGKSVKDVKVVPVSRMDDMLKSPDMGEKSLRARAPCFLGLWGGLMI